MEKTKHRVRVKVFLVDEHPIMRDGLALHINRQPDFAVCGEAPNGVDAAKDMRRLQPDILLIGIAPADSSHVAWIEKWHTQYPQMKIMVLFAGQGFSKQSLQAGAHGYLSKNEAAERLISAIRQVMEGKIYLSASVQGQIIDDYLIQLVPTARPVSPLPGHLTEREIEVFRLSGEGLKRQDIADKLRLSPKTVDTYRAIIRDKLGIRTSAELIARAAHWLNSGKN